MPTLASSAAAAARRRRASASAVSSAAPASGASGYHDTVNNAPAGAAPEAEVPSVGPLPFREDEYACVLRFVLSRLQEQTSRALFISGACGCGKTSTALRAARLVSRQRLAIDRGAAPYTLAEPELGVGTRADSSGNTDGAGPAKRARLSKSSAAASSSCESTPRGSAGRLSTDSTASTTSAAHAPPPQHAYKEQYAARLADLQRQFPLFFARYGAAPHTDGEAAAAAGGKSTAPRRRAATAAAGALAEVQGHYVNCADLKETQLRAAVLKTLADAGAAQPLLDLIEELGSHRQGARGGGGGGDSSDTMWPADGTEGDSVSARSSTGSSPGARGRRSSSSSAGAAGGRRSRRQQQQHHPVMQLLVMDEVEYSGAPHVLQQLCVASLRLPALLSLIFISNQKDMITVVPVSQLETLTFAAYAQPQLGALAGVFLAREVAAHERALRQATTSAAVGHKRRRPAGAATDDAPVTPPAALATFIAGKALLEHSGDVRQLRGMCHHVVARAYADAAATDADTAAGRSEALHRAAAPTAPAAASSPPTAAAPHAHQTRGAATAGALAAPPVPAPPARRASLTVGRSAAYLRGGTVESQMESHIRQMPLHTLYVLCCLSVLSARGGGGGGLSAPRTVRVREVHQLYGDLMSQLFFPPMNDSGVRAAVEQLADLGILTRPRRPASGRAAARRGARAMAAAAGDAVVTFNGVWTLEGMEEAVLARGRAIQAECAAAGFPESENQFEEALRILRQGAARTAF